MFTVKVGKMPGRVEELAVESGATVVDLLELAELDTDGFQIRKNGEEVGLNDEVQDGDIVLLTKMIKGNSDVFVKVGKMPGRVEELAISSDASVQDLLELAELDTEGFQIRKNGEEVSLSDTVDNGDIVLLTKMIKGNK